MLDDHWAAITAIRGVRGPRLNRDLPYEGDLAPMLGDIARALLELRDLVLPEEGIEMGRWSNDA